MYRQEDNIFTPALNGVGLTIKVRGRVHEVDSIVDIRDASLHQPKLLPFTGSAFNQTRTEKSYKFRLEMCCECCLGRSIWYSSDAIFELGNQHLQDLALQTVQLHEEGLRIAESAHIDQNEQLQKGCL